MLVTLVIGLREGLEAALIVGIIAAFLRNNGKSLVPMWIGVASAVVLSVAVGAGLSIVEQSLPQAQQEAMESIIGAIAVFFVTTMIIWMHKHSRGMKKELEAEAAQALSQGSAYALAVMAFLAVLKEGFETSVFLLATFSSTQSSALAALGAVIGILIAAAIGWGIYAGGVRLNLSRFFRWTGAFLILVAAGLVITTLRTAHEAGWLNAGQQTTVSLAWLIHPGTVPAALITGVLGVPADPRLIEVVGWFAFLIPVALFVYWPAKHRAKGMAAVRLQWSIAGALAAAAVILAVAFPIPQLQTPPSAPLTSSTDPSATVGTATLNQPDGNTMSLTVNATDGTTSTVPLPADESTPATRDGIEASVWTQSATTTPANAPATVTLDQLVAYAGGRIPVGLNRTQNPGPFTARWSAVTATTVWVSHDALLDATSTPTTVVTVSGGGLTSPRTVALDDKTLGGWAVSTAYVNSVASSINDHIAARTERALWAIAIPIAMLIAAALLTLSGFRARRRLNQQQLSQQITVPEKAPTPSESADPGNPPASDQQEKRSTTYVPQ